MQDLLMLGWVSCGWQSIHLTQHCSRTPRNSFESRLCALNLLNESGCRFYLRFLQCLHTMLDKILVFLKKMLVQNLKVPSLYKFLISGIKTIRCRGNYVCTLPDFECKSSPYCGHEKVLCLPILSSLKIWMIHV